MKKHDHLTKLVVKGLEICHSTPNFHGEVTSASWLMAMMYKDINKYMRKKSYDHEFEHSYRYFFG